MDGRYAIIRTRRKASRRHKSSISPSDEMVARFARGLQRFPFDASRKHVIEAVPEHMDNVELNSLPGKINSMSSGNPFMPLSKT